MEPNDDSQLIFIGSQNPLDIKNYDLYAFSHEDIRDIKTELNTDDKPIIEFSTALDNYNPIQDRFEIPFKDPKI